MVLPLSQINFGAADAVHEVEDDRDLLVHGYFDLHGAVERSLSHADYLVMGYKGSGKTALGQHLSLTAAARGIIVRNVSLRLLKFSEFPGMLKRGDDWQTTYHAVWSFHLFTQLIDILASRFRSEGHEGGSRFSSVVSQLQQAGALPAADLPTAIRTFQGRAEALEAWSSGPDSGALEALNATMLEAILDLRLPARPILILDGLDEVLHPSFDDLLVLTGLVEAVGMVNRAFSAGGSGTNPKVMILCRTDLFDRLPGANTTKLREDRSIHLDWFQNTSDPEETHLVKLLNIKARVSDPGIESVRQSYFPKLMNDKPTMAYFLDHTRHTPRDFLRVFRHVQKYSSEDTTMDYRSINQGLRTYSTYFNSEIKNELSGYASEADIEQMFRLLRGVGKVQFNLADLRHEADEQGSSLDLVALVTRLFDCSALGLVESHVTFSRRLPRYTFKYRNPHVSVNLEADFRVHVGWRRHLSVATARQEEEGLRLPAESSGGRRRRRTRRGSLGSQQPELPFSADDEPKTTAPVADPTRVSRRPRGGASRPQGPPRAESRANDAPTTAQVRR